MKGARTYAVQEDLGQATAEVGARDRAELWERVEMRICACDMRHTSHVTHHSHLTPHTSHISHTSNTARYNLATHRAASVLLPSQPQKLFSHGLSGETIGTETHFLPPDARVCYDANLSRAKASCKMNVKPVVIVATASGAMCTHQRLPQSSARRW